MFTGNKVLGMGQGGKSKDYANKGKGGSLTGGVKKVNKQLAIGNGQRQCSNYHAMAKLWAFTFLKVICQGKRLNHRGYRKCGVTDCI